MHQKNLRHNEEFSGNFSVITDIFPVYPMRGFS